MYKNQVLTKASSWELLVVNSCNYSVTSYIFYAKQWGFSLLKQFVLIIFFFLNLPNLFYTVPLHCNIIFENSCKGKILFPALLQIIQISKLVESALALIWSVWEGPQNHFFPQPSLLQIKYLNFFFFPHRSYLTNL